VKTDNRYIAHDAATMTGWMRANTKPRLKGRYLVRCWFLKLYGFFADWNGVEWSVNGVPLNIQQRQWCGLREKQLTA
jgi:hypothetical protein